MLPPKLKVGAQVPVLSKIPGWAGTKQDMGFYVFCMYLDLAVKRFELPDLLLTLAFTHCCFANWNIFFCSISVG